MSESWLDEVFTEGRGGVTSSCFIMSQSSVTSSSVSESSSLGRIRRLLRLRKNSPFTGVLNFLRFLTC